MDTHYCTNCCTLHYLSASLNEQDVCVIPVLCMFKFSCVFIYFCGGMVDGEG